MRNMSWNVKLLISEFFCLKLLLLPAQGVWVEIIDHQGVWVEIIDHLVRFLRCSLHREYELKASRKNHAGNCCSLHREYELKCLSNKKKITDIAWFLSLPTWRVWVEIAVYRSGLSASLPRMGSMSWNADGAETVCVAPRMGECELKCIYHIYSVLILSFPAQGVWVEIRTIPCKRWGGGVARRMGSVGWNI